MYYYQENGRLITSTIEQETTIPFNIVNGRKYKVMCVKYDFTFTMKLFDSVTGDECSVSNLGW